MHEEIACLVRRLGERPEQAATPAGTPAAATDASASASEHLLLQLPLLLLPSAACSELCQLQQRMLEELVSGDAATAAQQHVLPLINDIAAALNMRSMAAGDPAAAVQQVLFNTEQKHVLKQLLQYMSDQSLDAVAATLCSQLGVQDVRQLHVSEGQQGTPTTAAPPEASAQAPAGVPEIEAAAADESGTAPAEQHTSASTASSAADGGLAPGAQHAQAVHSKQAAKALEQASAASEQAVAAQRAAAATESALQLALQQISLLSAAAAAQASRQAADVQAAATSASQRAAAVEDAAERQRALQLIASPAGGPPAAGARGVGIWGLLGGNARAVAAGRAAGTALLGGVMRNSEPPLVPEQVSRRDVLLGFSDERLEV